MNEKIEKDEEAAEAKCLDYIKYCVDCDREVSRQFGVAHEAEAYQLAALIVSENIFLNSHWWEREWPKEARKTVALCVNCNDVFMWGSADAEGVFEEEISDLYDHWEKDPEWGVAVWCMKKRNLMPQKPVEDKIRKAGIWDLDSMGLRTRIGG